MGFFFRLILGASGLWLAEQMVEGIVIDTTGTLVLAAFLLGIVNAVVRPVVVFLTLPLTLLTLGLFVFVINAAMLGLVALLLSGFHIAGAGSALAGSLIVSLTGWIASGFVSEKGDYEVIVVESRRRGRER